MSRTLMTNKKGLKKCFTYLFVLLLFVPLKKIVTLISIFIRYVTQSSFFYSTLTWKINFGADNSPVIRYFDHDKSINNKINCWLNFFFAIWIGIPTWNRKELPELILYLFIIIIIIFIFYIILTSVQRFFYLPPLNRFFFVSCMCSSVPSVFFLIYFVAVVAITRLRGQVAGVNTSTFSFRVVSFTFDIFGIPVNLRTLRKGPNN